MASGPECCEEERKEEDLEDLDPERSGGEFGVVVQTVVISAGKLQSSRLFPDESKGRTSGDDR